MNKYIDKLFNDLYNYEKELEEYNNGVFDSYVRDLEYNIKSIKEKINKIINEKVHEYNDSWINYDTKTLKNICESVFDLYQHENYENIEECIGYVFAIYEDNESEG